MEDGEVFQRSVALSTGQVTQIDFERGQGEMPLWLRTEQAFDTNFAPLTLWLSNNSGVISLLESVESPCRPGPTLRQFNETTIGLYRLPNTTTFWVSAPNGLLLQGHQSIGLTELRALRADSKAVRCDLAAIAKQRGLQTRSVFTYEVQLPFTGRNAWVLIDRIEFEPTNGESLGVWHKRQPKHLPSRIRLLVPYHLPETIPFER